jgi:hypothetical protein
MGEHTPDTFLVRMNRLLAVRLISVVSTLLCHGYINITCLMPGRDGGVAWCCADVLTAVVITYVLTQQQAF